MSDTNSGNTEEDPESKKEKAELAVWLLTVGVPTTFLLLGYDALVLMWFWRWFLTPLGVAEIGYWHSLGIMVLWKFLLNKRKNADSVPIERTIEERKQRKWNRFSTATFFLVIGFIVHWLMTR